MTFITRIRRWVNVGENFSSCHESNTKIKSSVKKRVVFLSRTDQRRSEIIIQIDDLSVVKRPAHNGGTQKTMIRWQRICSYWNKISVVLITSTRFWSKKTCSKRHPRSMWRSVFVDGYHWTISLSKIGSASWLLKILREILEKRICSRKMSV